jgi:hypothetical protein
MAKTIPNKDADFHDRQDIITATTEENMTKWGINKPWYDDQIAPAKREWVTAWNDYLNLMQRTRLITFIKNEKRQTYERMLRILVQVINCNPQITNEERCGMGIAVRDRTGTPVKQPKSYPTFNVDSSMIRRLKIVFWDLDATSKAKPHEIHGAEICWAILDHPPLSVDELIHSSFDTRSPFTLTFTESERGKAVYFCLRWENTRGEKGPWSEIVMAIIP